jgi:hypothetical protein
MSTMGIRREEKSAVLRFPPPGNRVEAAKVCTREARRYAILEVVRRGGVSDAISNSWQIELDDRFSTIYLEPSRKKKLIFPVSRPGSAGFGSACAVRASWVHKPSKDLDKSVPDFVIPTFPGSKVNSSLPIFTSFDQDTIVFNYDIPTGLLWALSRLEETAIVERDSHGRFPVSESLAFRENFLHRPIVDEYGFAFEQALKCLFPSWSAKRPSFRVKLTHDVDEVGIPFSLRATLGHTLRRRASQATLKDILSTVSSGRPAYLQCVMRLAELSREYALDSAFYWKASPAGKNDSGYNPREQRVKSTISWLRERGFECGVHPGYDTFGNQQGLRDEVAVLRECIGQHRLGGRQHYLRWKPETWMDWETCQLAYDSTVGYAEWPGFRAGTCIPYRPWLFEENREADLVEIPLLVMDRTLAYYRRISTEESYAVVIDIVERCRAVGGVFTLLWHNDALLDPVYENLYSRILELLSGSPGFRAC